MMKAANSNRQHCNKLSIGKVHFEALRQALQSGVQKIANPQLVDDS